MTPLVCAPLSLFILVIPSRYPFSISIHVIHSRYSRLVLALQETAASYGLGAVGSLVYLRMLNRSIDGVGGVGAALGQPRLLVPVILTAAYNRYDPSDMHCNSHQQAVCVLSASLC